MIVTDWFYQFTKNLYLYQVLATIFKMPQTYDNHYLEVFEDFCILGFVDIFDELHTSPRIEIQIILASK